MKRQTRARSLLVIAAVCGVLSMFLVGWPSGHAPAEAATPAESVGIAVTGLGAVWVQPDVAKLSLGVTTTAGTVSEARSRAAAAMQAVQDALRAKGVADKDVQTQYFNVSPQYAYADRAQPSITGYTVSNAVQVTVRTIDSASDVLDAAVAAGGNAVRVNGIAFTVDDPERFMAQAREAAVKNAYAHADVLARAAGVAVGRPLSIVEGGGNVPFPVAPKAAATGGAQSAPPTPINPGEQQLQVTVSILYEIR